MLDIKFVRDNPEEVLTALKNRGNSLTLDGFMELEKERRDILGEVEVLKSQRNAVSKQISEMKKK
jgi:seryl-tRNA synthetase